jgi:membrane-associated phospholipid phosphatase
LFRRWQRIRSERQGYIPTVSDDVVLPTDVARRWTLVRRGLLVAYLVAYVVFVWRVGIILDRISVLLSLALLLAVAMVGRPARVWRRTAIDFLLYTAMWVAYDETRGLADGLGRPVLVESVRDADRWLLGGTDASVWMQDRFYSPYDVRWYDVLASIVYYSHFVVPVAVIAALWINRRHEWIRFMRRFATVLAIACVSFVLFPTAPPWMAASGSGAVAGGAIDAVVRPAGRGWRELGLDGFSRVWETGRDWANPVAAMPSLHAGFSLFLVVFFLPRVGRRWVQVLMLVYPLSMAVALVYLAEHWIVDVLAGWLVVGLSFLVWSRIERRSSSLDESSLDESIDAAPTETSAGELVPASSAAGWPAEPDARSDSD